MSTCESRVGIAPIKVTCQKSLELAQKMQYGSCTEVIEELCNSYYFAGNLSKPQEIEFVREERLEIVA